MNHYWKVAVYDEDLCGFIVRAVCLKKSDAMELTRELTAQGFIARASKQINLKKEYYYGE